MYYIITVDTKSGDIFNEDNIRWYIVKMQSV